MPLRAVVYAVGAALAYVVSPVDLIPDFPGVGWIDDLFVLGLLGWYLFKYLPARTRAARPMAPSVPPAEDVDDDGFAERFQSADPHVVLGLAPSADDAAVKHAYRDLLTQYHPDKVAHLSTEFQDLAHRRAVAIQAAYARLGGE